MDLAGQIELEMPRRCHGVIPRFREREEEREYRVWRADRAVPFAQVAMNASIVGWLAFAGASLLIGPQLSRMVLPATIFLVTPLVIGVFFAARVQQFRHLLLPVSTATNMIGGLVSVMILRESGVGFDSAMFADVGTATAVLYVYYGCTILRLPPTLAAIGIAPYVLLQQFYVVRAFAGDQPRYIAFTVILWVAVVSGLWLSWALERVWRDTFQQEQFIQAQAAVIEQERQRSETLLQSILPSAIAEQLKTRPGTVAELHDDVTVIFADLVGFTPLSSGLSPSEIVSLLNLVFSRFDDLCAQHGVEKIKTIGDAYMAVAGLPTPHADHAESGARLALAMRAAVGDLEKDLGRPLGFRIGMHSGPVVAGVIGTSKFAYDLWGDTVNMAARMESHGVEGEIQVGEELAKRLQASGFMLRERGAVNVKGKGDVATWFLEAGPH